MMILSRDLNIGLLNFSSRIPLNLPPILAQSQSPSKAPSRIISWCRGRFWGGRKKMCVDPGEPWAMRMAPWGSRLAMVSGRLRVPESLYSILNRVKGPLTPPDCPRAPTREAPTTNTPRFFSAQQTGPATASGTWIRPRTKVSKFDTHPSRKLRSTPQLKPASSSSTARSATRPRTKVAILPPPIPMSASHVGDDRPLPRRQEKLSHELSAQIDTDSRDASSTDSAGLLLSPGPTTPPP